MRAFAIFPVLVLFSACGQPVENKPDLPDTSCSAESLQHLVGQPENAFDARDLDEPVRIIHPGDAVTQDFVPKRLNVEIGSDGRIAAIRCG